MDRTVTDNFFDFLKDEDSALFEAIQKLLPAQTLNALSKRVETYASQMDEFAEWASVNRWKYNPHTKMWSDHENYKSTSQLREMFRNREGND